MSMNFAREQSLLRQRLQAKGSPGQAAALQQQHGGTMTFLGAPDAEVSIAANDLHAAHPGMGRAQMTAFVRTLWKSKIHELRAVGVQLLALRASLLEPADLPFLEELLGDDATDAVLQQLAGAVLGALVGKNKKLWKDLRRLATGSHDGLRRAALRATCLPLAADGDAFARFAELAEPLLAHADALVQAAIDAALVAAATSNHAAATTFVQRHARSVVLPAPRPAAPAAAATKPVPAPTEAKAPKGAVVKAAAAKADVAKADVAKPTMPAKATPTTKPGAKKAAPKQTAAKAPAAKKPAAKNPAPKKTAGRAKAK